MYAYDLIFILDLVTCVLAGLVLGSFSTVLIHRMPRHESILGRKPSTCPECKTQLKWRSMWPVFSWVFQKGRCLNCEAPISRTYPLAEGMCLILSLCFYAAYGHNLITVAMILTTPVLTAMLFIDLKHMIIPDRLNLSLGFLSLAALGAYAWNQPLHMVETAFLQMLAGGVMFFAVALILAYGVSFALKKQALGGGDIKFFAAAGLWLGPMGLPLFMFLGGLFGVVMAVAMRGRSDDGAFPFAPSLILALILLLVFKQHVFLTIL